MIRNVGFVGLYQTKAYLPIAYCLAVAVRCCINVIITILVLIQIGDFGKLM